MEAVRESCLLANGQLHELEKNCNRLSRLLEYAIWEEDMVQDEQIVFTGSTQEFLKLLEPLFRCGHWKVNGKNNREAFFRAIDSVVRIQPEKGASRSIHQPSGYSQTFPVGRVNDVPFFINKDKKRRGKELKVRIFEQMPDESALHIQIRLVMMVQASIFASFKNTTWGMLL